MTDTASPHGLPRHLDPWPHDSLEEHGDTFDPDRPRFADVPIITMTDSGARVTRGDVADEDLREWLLQVLPNSLEPGDAVGVFISREGDRWATYPVGAEVALDWRILRVVPVVEEIERVRTLDELVDKIAAVADRIRTWLADGWVQAGPFDVHSAQYYDSRYTSR